ncbi:IS66 family transposase [Pandoraea iniqua]|uniref:IS66 family transposase n=1 Tax=Pandoraea iniqua TaxID=2508288 RepID=UPI001FE3F69E|nr:IS66 family transposase [Pandoraea iniqua]
MRDDTRSGSTEPTAVLFVYAPDRKSIRPPPTPLAEFEGILQADANTAFDERYESGKIREAACWNHTR